MPAFLIPVDEGTPIPLEKAIVFIGRHPECDVLLRRSRKVSRKHCCIAQINDRFVIRDLGSTNGVSVNGQRVQNEAPLQLGDEIVIGDARYRLQSQLAGKAKLGPRPGATLPPAGMAQTLPREMPNALPPAISQEFPVALPDDDMETSGRDTPPSEIPIYVPEDER